MERLTKTWGNNCVAVNIDYIELLDLDDNTYSAIMAIIERLAEFEDAHENGCSSGVEEAIRDKIEEYSALGSIAKVEAYLDCLDIIRNT